MKCKQVVCEYCDKIFDKEIKKINWSTKKGWRTYCSKKCQDLDKITSEIINCAICGKKTTKVQAEIKRSKSGKLFCSKHCATIFNNTMYKSGINHPNYKNGDKSYRDLAFALKEVKCEMCDYCNKDILQVHHKDKNRKNNAIDNLEILCPTHHWEKHLLKTKNVRV